MKFCTHSRVTDGKVTDIIDISIVDDNHQFGLSPDGKTIHIKGGTITVTKDQDDHPR